MELKTVSGFGVPSKLLFVVFAGQDEIGERLAEMIVRKKTFISSMMSLVESYEFGVRRYF